MCNKSIKGHNSGSEQRRRVCIVIATIYMFRTDSNFIKLMRLYQSGLNTTPINPVEMATRKHELPSCRV
ncbi:hypothetical protein RRG08_024698 [Elysia crispata]|uniref:Uncharacterized protein n=1 Tax=Elysia crispata TaxID=231223 RepID=A0AAE1CXG6_9GAST|nr:hypothetical protein RRG08_024698 [Elysia crispata]